MRSLLAILICLAAVADAEACSRCRRNPCIYVKPVAAAYVAPVVASPNVFVIQANYPVAPLSPSAFTSNGGYQSSVYPIHDPRIAMSGAIEVTKAAQLMVSSSLNQTLQANERLSQIYAPAVEVNERGIAGERLLNAAGLNPSHNTQQQQSFVISVGPDGVKSEKLTYEQALSITTKSTTTAITEPPAAPPARVQADYPFVTQFCGKCHGFDNKQPAKGFYIGVDPNVAKSMDAAYRRMTNMVISGAMPQGTTLTDDEKKSVISELDAIIEKGLSQSAPAKE